MLPTIARILTEAEEASEDTTPAAPAADTTPAGGITKEGITQAMTAIGLRDIDVGEGTDRWWATGRVSRHRVSPQMLKRAVSRTYEKVKFRVNKRGNELYLIIYKPAVKESTVDRLCELMEAEASEALNAVGDREFYSYNGWVRACRMAGADRFDGDRDICTALRTKAGVSDTSNQNVVVASQGPDVRPDRTGGIIGIGEWDGEKGCVYAPRSPAPVTEHCVQEPMKVAASGLRRYLDPDSAESAQKIKPGKSKKLRGLDGCVVKVSRLEVRPGMADFQLEPVKEK